MYQFAMKTLCRRKFCSYAITQHAGFFDKQCHLEQLMDPLDFMRVGIRKKLRLIFTTGYSHACPSLPEIVELAYHGFFIAKMLLANHIRGFFNQLYF